jgi:hypothetical protein
VNGRGRHDPPGFSIDAVLASARDLAGRAAARAPDLALASRDPREGLRALFTPRDDRRAFDIPEPLSAVVAARYAASLGGADVLHQAPETIFALDALSGEPADERGPVLSPSRTAAEWANDHELGHFADRAGTDRRAWFERYDFRVKHVREIVADGFAHVLAILRFGAAGRRHAACRADWRAHNLVTYGDAAHFTTYASGPFLALAQALWERGETAGTIDPALLLRHCRALAARAALSARELDELQTLAGKLRLGERDLGTTTQRVAGGLVEAGRRSARYRLAAAALAVDAQGWYGAMARANPADADLLRTARAVARLDDAVAAVGALLTGRVAASGLAGAAATTVVASFLAAAAEVLACPVPAARGPAERVRRDALRLKEELGRAAASGDRAGAALLILHGALALAWEGTRLGVLPGYLDRTVRSHGRGLVALAHALRVHGAVPRPSEADRPPVRSLAAPRGIVDQPAAA